MKRMKSGVIALALSFCAVQVVNPDDSLSNEQGVREFSQCHRIIQIPGLQTTFSQTVQEDGNKNYSIKYKTSEDSVSSDYFNFENERFWIETDAHGNLLSFENYGLVKFKISRVDTTWQVEYYQD